MGRTKSVLGVLLALLLLVAGAGIAGAAPRMVIDRSHGQTVDLSGFTSVLVGWEVVGDQLDEIVPLTADVLNACNLLVVPQPVSSDFTDAEVALVHSYVEAGGGLWVLYDADAPQPNFNKLPAAFGVTFNPGVVTDYDWNSDTYIDQLLVSTPYDLVSHPLFAGVTAFSYYRGVSLNPGSSPVVVTATTTARVDGVPQSEPPLLAAADVGTGHVVFVGDATPLEPSVYPVLDPETKQLLDNIVTWLKKPEAPPVPTTKKVTINIRPWSKDNKIDLQSKGFIRVAVLSTPEFDAKQVDPKTVLFAGAKPLCWVRMDVDRDRDKDLLLLFHIPDLNLTEDSTEAVLDGKTLDGQSFEGRDAVQVVQHKKCKNPPKHDNCGGKKGK